MSSHVVVDTRGRKRLSRVAIAPLSAHGEARPEWFACDLLAVSGGYSPVVHLHSQSQGKLDYDETYACFRPNPR
jgi:sarcosine oxidase, subunit alpha